MEINETIKFKCRGMKTKFRVMGTGETITENSVACEVLSHDNHISSDAEYDYCLKIATDRTPELLTWFRSNSVGESIAPYHTCRVYLEQLTNL